MTKLPRPLNSLSIHALRAISLGVLLGGLGAQLQAQTLSELVTQARGFDASWQAQQADARAAASRADQARSGLLPSVGMSAGVTRTHVDINTSVPIASLPGSSNNTQQNLQVTAQQPLYRPANKIAYEQGRRGMDVAQAQLDTASQNLIIRVAQAYFDVLAAQDSVQVAQAQKKAISTQLEMAKRNFEVGTATITDSHEAQSRFDLVTAQEIAAQNDLQIKRVVLDQLVGRVGVQPTRLAAPLTLPKVDPDNVQSWVDTALATQPQIRQAQLALDIAKLDTQKAEAGHKPTVDLQAGYVVNRYPNGSMTPAIPLSYRTNAAQIGVVMNVPLFAGFAVQNRIKETVALEEKARAQLDDARRSVEQATRTAFLGVQSGQAQVKALEAALASSKSALDANKTGYEVGVRINIDVLNAQSQVFQTERDLANARYQVLLGQLKLRQASGVLSDDSLRSIDALTLSAR
ncbi:channel protein TolC [Comamonas testosteroni]|uniref:Channel protein TolC n=1 Tax=Comamonas testosteroni TaxID=285 RepID=A0A373FU38_COMTE|nr:TolC family outer membrane protein [Comamonas testosteroni]RGE47052.1 channel protein TolC [Comamonas testosteroni]